MNKRSKLIIFTTIIALLFAGSYIYRHSSIEKAMQSENINFNEILYEVEYDSHHTIVFYTNTNFIYSALIKKSIFGYKFQQSSGSDLYPEDFIASWSVSNYNNLKSDDKVVTVAKGLLFDEEVETMILHFPHGDEPVEIVETSIGRIWFSSPKVPINSGPEVTFTYKDGATKSGWNK